MKNESVLLVFTKFKRWSLYTFFLFSITACVNVVLKYIFPNAASPIVGYLILILIAGVITSYILLLAYFYKLAKLLKAVGKMKTSPSLLLILMILCTVISFFFVVNIIIFVKIHKKTVAYLKESPKTQ